MSKGSATHLPFAFLHSVNKFLYNYVYPCILKIVQNHSHMNSQIFENATRLNIQ